MRGFRETARLCEAEVSARLLPDLRFLSNVVIKQRSAWVGLSNKSRTALKRRGTRAETGLHRPFRVYLPQANAAFSPGWRFLGKHRGFCRPCILCAMRLSAVSLARLLPDLRFLINVVIKQRSAILRSCQTHIFSPVHLPSFAISNPHFHAHHLLRPVARYQCSAMSSATTGRPAFSTPIPFRFAVFWAKARRG
jgi:hypothetical protein